MKKQDGTGGGALAFLLGILGGTEDGKFVGLRGLSFPQAGPHLLGRAEG